ncbi:recombinase family protein [Prochlorococcus sp. MIT 1300]|uniref:recombinase family protein n=1 Tax=Prochlorococcus sp. MIT 1300 TaxID=3096218 RepID=UPI002A7589E7|nr:recombinase family protein [Prochlorococcus sp. MIT 1300]
MEKRFRSSKNFFAASHSFMARARKRSVGYARIGIDDVDAQLQVAELRAAGCKYVVQELSSREDGLPGIRLEEVVCSLGQADQLVVTKISRLGLKKIELLWFLRDLESQGKHLKTLDGFLDTKLLEGFAVPMLGLLIGCSDLEQSLNKEQAIENIHLRRIQGGNINMGGRPKTSAIKEALVLRLRGEGCSYRSIREQTGLALSTIRRIIVSS